MLARTSLAKSLNLNGKFYKIKIHFEFIGMKKCIYICCLFAKTWKDFTEFSWFDVYSSVCILNCKKIQQQILNKVDQVLPFTNNKVI